MSPMIPFVVLCLALALGLVMALPFKQHVVSKPLAVAHAAVMAVGTIMLGYAAFGGAGVRTPPEMALAFTFWSGALLVSLVVLDARFSAPSTFDTRLLVWTDDALAAVGTALGAAGLAT